MSSPDSDGEASASVSMVAMAAGVVGVLGLLLLAVGGVLVLDSGPPGEGAGGNATGTPTVTGNEPGGNPSDGSGDPSGNDGSNGAGNDPDHVRPFSITIEEIEECGTTCRDVTATLVNNGGNPRENVTVTTELYAGSDRVWKGKQSLGTFPADGTKTRTRQIDVGFVGGAKIQQNDGNVTIVTTVRWDGGSATYREQRNVL